MTLADAVGEAFAAGFGASTRRPQDDAQLEAYVADCWGVRFPKDAVCPGHVAPWQVFCDAYFARSPVAVLKASRLFGGKSFMLSVLGLTEAVTLGVDVDVLGGSGLQSSRVVKYMRDHIHAPGAPRAECPDDFKRGETELPNGAIVRPVMASQTSIRGSHATRLRLDEADEIKRDHYDAASGITFTQRGVPAQKLVASTHQYPDGTMTAAIAHAEKHGQPVHEYCFKETSEHCLDGWLPDAEVERKRAEFTEAAWRAEVELQEPSPEGRAIMTEAVETTFDADRERADDGAELVLEPPTERGTYATGVDWAKRTDWTVIWTWRMDTQPARLVAYWRMQRRPWPDMIQAANERVRAYRGSAAHDATGMNVQGDYLSEAFRDFQFAGQAREVMLGNYIRAMERGDFRGPRIRTAYSEHRFATRDDVYRGGTGHLPDTLSAAALAYWSFAQWETVDASRFMA